MKYQRSACVVVGESSIGAGGANAVLPNNVPVDATNIPATTTGAPEHAVATDITVPATTVPETTTRDTTDSVHAELPDRSESVVATVDGSNVVGTALRVVGELEDLGYVDLLPLNGTDTEELTTVYLAAGFEEAALWMAEDLDLLAECVASIEDSPSVADPPADIKLLAFMGRDCT